MALALRTRREYNGHEIVLERPDGRRVTVLAHANPIHDDKGRLLGAVNVLLDISDRKRTEDTLRLADRAKNEFLATLAHELRNPLAPLRNALDILQRKAQENAELQPEIGVLDRQLRTMTRLVDDLLDVARISGDKLDLRRERIDLGDVVRVALETAQPLVEEGGQTLSVNVPSEPVLLDGDLTRLAQAAGNLLTNAVKYTDHGDRITLTAMREGSEAVIRVADTGIGIPPDMLPRIFDMFMQLPAPPERQRSGLGVGLTLVKRLVEAHNGSIEARSEGAGRGAEFVLRLPAAADARSRPSWATATADASAMYPSLRILVVDDNRDSADSLGMLLELMGHQIRLAHDGVHAVQMADEFRPDVVLLDIGLPRMNGCDAARRIREQPWGRDMLLIATTGWGQETDRHNSKAAGFDHHLVKPVDATSLMKWLTKRMPARLQA
jgi:signal transduction histidine kinase/CheY-like chemotaxis protein